MAVGLSAVEKLPLVPTRAYRPLVPMHACLVCSTVYMYAATYEMLQYSAFTARDIYVRTMSCNRAIIIAS